MIDASQFLRTSVSTKFDLVPAFSDFHVLGSAYSMIEFTSFSSLPLSEREREKIWWDANLCEDGGGGKAKVINLTSASLVIDRNTCGMMMLWKVHLLMEKKSHYLA